MSSSTCPKCGATLVRPGATCRRCLLGLALQKDPGEPEGATTSARPAPTPPPSPAELAPLFPELELEALIGVGGMGVVYRARQKRLGRAVALKVLHAELSRDPVFVERFLREAQAMARLTHPGIVAVHDFGEREGRCFLVMELVDGANLRALLRQGTLGARQSLDIVRQLCDALQFAHDEGVVHRDIKPENVLVDLSGRVKVADFGLAKLMGPGVPQSLTDAGQVMGTPHYMAPEQLERPRDVDHRADLFSLGVVFYEMLTGELPLGRFAPPSQRVQVDVRLDEIVLRSLEHERERRYQQAAEVKTAVESVERGPAPVAAPGTVKSAPPVLGTREPAAEEERFIGLFWSLGTRRSDWGWLLLLFLAWLGCAASFDLGPVPFALLSLPLLGGLFFALLRTEVPPAGGLERWSHRLGAGLLVGLGLVALFVAHISVFERWTWQYVSNDQAPTAGLELGPRANERLLESIGVANPGTHAALEMDSGHWLGNPYALFGIHPLVLFGLAGLLFLWAALERLEFRRAGLAASLRLAGRALCLWFGSLALVHCLAFVLHGNHQSMVRVSAARSCHAGGAELTDALYRALIARGFEVHAEHRGRLVSQPSGVDLALHDVLKAAPASPFERWRMTWAGPERVQPHVMLRIVTSLADERATLEADAGMVERAGPEESAWRAWLEQLLAEACDAVSER